MTEVLECCYVLEIGDLTFKKEKSIFFSLNSIIKVSFRLYYVIQAFVLARLAGLSGRVFVWMEKRDVPKRKTVRSGVLFIQQNNGWQSSGSETGSRHPTTHTTRCG